MKSTLLTTTALIAFAGAAYADGHAGISFSGSATLGYNDTDIGTTGQGISTTTTSDDNVGFYADMELDVTMTAALDNGITVTATADVDELDASDDDFDGVTLEIASETASLTFGDTNSSADTHWSGVDGDTVGDFRGNTEHLDAFDAVLRGEATFGDVTGSISYGISTQDNSDPQFGALQVAAVADVAGFTLIGAFEAEDTDFGLDQQFGVSASGTFSGFEVMGSYLSAETDNTTSLGVSVAYTFSPVTIGGYYSLNESDDADDALDAFGLDLSYENGAISVEADVDFVEDADEPTWEVDANYDTGLNAIVHVGLNSEEEFYGAVTYDLGGGASLLVSYAEGDDSSDADDEIGEDDLQVGTTVEVSFSF